MAYETEGTLTTDERTVDISETWDTQTEWEAYQSIANIDITDGVLQLAERELSGTSVFSFETGDLSNWDNSPTDASVEQTEVFQGSYSVLLDDNEEEVLYSADGSGLNYYPEPDGTTFYYAQYNDEAGDHRFGWGGNGGSDSYNSDGYQIQHRPTNDRFELSVNDTSLDTDSTSPPLDEWLINEVTWTSDGDITVSVQDTSLTEIASLSANDTTITDSGEVWIAARDAGSGGRCYFDGVNSDQI